MAAGEGFAQYEHRGRVDAAGVGDRVEALLEREGQAATVAEAFFLREGAARPAAAGVVGVGHVEDAHWPWHRGAGDDAGGGCGGGEDLLGKRDSGIEGIGVEDADRRAWVVGAEFRV